MELAAYIPNTAFEQGIANFSFELYGAVEKRRNEFISSYSISAALLLLMLGTNGSTEDQIKKSIFKGETPTNVYSEYKRLHEKLTDKTKTGVVLDMANRLYGSKHFTLLDYFKSNALKYFESDMERLDFVSQTEQSRIRINNWVAAQTRNKIRNMIPPNILNVNTLVVLVNAIYFKGIWKNQFDRKETRKQTFFDDLNIQWQVDMMHGIYNATAGQSIELDCRGLRLEYSGNKMSMVFLLPNDVNGLQTLEKKLTLRKFQNLLSMLIKQKTTIEIPKFTVQAEYDLKPIFARLGITEIFDDSIADFTHLVPIENSKGVYVSDARHRTYVEVNEEGSEAAAATTIVTSTKSMPIHFQFIADHPFMFVILDNETGIPLFIGRYVRP